MTQEIANSWWNKVANYGADLNSNPILPSPSRMCEICFELSPIFPTHLSLLLSEEDFWKEARNIGKTITHIDPFPDPLTNFPLFILYIYTFRDILKPTTVDNSLLYVSSLCPSPPGDFFLKKFIFALSDPVLVVLSFHRMQEIKFPLWQSFLEQPGMAERIFDLYLPHFLIPLEPEDDYSSLTVKVYLADFLSQLLISNPNITFITKFAILLFKSIISIVESIPSHILVPETYSFLPIILSICNFSITCNRPELRRLISDKIISLPNKKIPFIGNILEWAFFHIDDNFLKPRELALSLVTKTKTSQYWTITYLGKLLSKYPNETASIIIPYFSKILFFHTIYMKITMKFIADYFNLESTDKRLREWFVIYIRYVFVSIKIFCLKNKYTNRIVTFLSVLSESSLMNIDFVKNIVIQSAQLCLSKETFFLTYFFDLKLKRRKKKEKKIQIENANQNQNQAENQDDDIYKYIINSSEAFNQEVKTLSIFKTKKIPFRKSGTALLPVIKGAITEPNFFIDPRVADLGISSKFSPFIYIDEAMDPSAQKLIKYSLVEIIESQRALIQDCFDARNSVSSFFDTSKISKIFSIFSSTIKYSALRKSNSSSASIKPSSSCSKLVSPSSLSLHPSSSLSTLNSISQNDKMKPFYVMNHKLYMNIMNSILLEKEQEVFAFQKNTIESFITMTSDLIEILNENPHLGVNSKKLLLYFEKERTDIPKYSEIKDKKSALIIFARKLYNKILTINPPKMSLTNKLAKALRLYENTGNDHFLPFNEFDIFFADYVNQEKFKDLMKAVVEMVKNNNDSTFPFTVDGVVNKLIKEQQNNVSNEHDRTIMYSILYSSLIRVIFNTAYDDNSDLFKSSEDNLKFLKRAENLSKEPLKSLNLDVFHNSNSDSISSFFNQDNYPNLKYLVFETNPLDICYQIHKVILSLIKVIQIPKKAITKGLKESIIYCAIISNPPENIMGIARLLIKWNNIYLIDEFDEIRNLFIKAVSRVQMIQL